MEPKFFLENGSDITIKRVYMISYEVKRLSRCSINSILYMIKQKKTRQAHQYGTIWDNKVERGKTLIKVTNKEVRKRRIG